MSNKWKIPYFDMVLGQEEEAALIEVVRSGWLTIGPKVEAFESAFAAFLGGGECIAVSSCTAALHTVLSIVGVGSGDEVLIPGLTFVADLNVVIATGATPIPIDCTSKSDWNISVEEVITKITPKTKAVIALHYAGVPCEIEKLASICKERGIVLIEDTAHALGTRLGGKSIGLFGDFACFSFYSNKNMTTAEGGMIVTRDRASAARCRSFRSHGMSALARERRDSRQHSYDILQFGLNYRMAEFSAALGIVQLGKLLEFNARRKILALKYNELLDSVKGVYRPWTSLPSDVVPSYHIYSVFFDSTATRDHIVEVLKEHGVQTSFHYPAFSSFTAFDDRGWVLPNADLLSSRMVTLPLYPLLKDVDVEFICGIIKSALSSR